jgi:serine/threonine-protein kinase
MTAARRVLVTPDVIGEVVGSYQIVSCVGEGGMGVVYVGVHALLGRRAAIKVLLPTLSRNGEVVQRFFNEARAVTQVADAGIVQVFDFGVHHDGSAFIVMELLEGESLDVRLARLGRLQPLDAVRLVRMICTSLAAAHAKGIVHRDLKPENLFVVSDPAVTGGERTKILDFGIAKLSAEPANKLKTRTGVLMGTPVYMSPEQCRGAGEVDARTDIYSIGCVMMTLLTGSPPFEGDGTGDLIVAHLREPAPAASSRVPGLPELLDHVLARCLAKSPDDRYASASELARALGDVEQRLVHSISPTIVVRIPTAQPDAAAPATPTTLDGAAAEVRRRAPSRPVRFVGATAMVAIATAAIVFAFSRAGSDASRRAASPPDRPVVVTTPALDAGVVVHDAPAVVDASIDAPGVDAPVVDAAVPAATPRPHRTIRPHERTEHVRPIPQNPAVDRGD